VVNWIDGSDGDKVAVVSEEGKATIYLARPNGELLILGDGWKECPRERGASHCPRRGRGEPTDFEVGKAPKCRQCSWSGVRHLESQEQAMRVARLTHVEIAREREAP